MSRKQKIREIEERRKKVARGFVNKFKRTFNAMYFELSREIKKGSNSFTSIHNDYWDDFYIVFKELATKSVNEFKGDVSKFVKKKKLIPKEELLAFEEYLDDAMTDSIIPYVKQKSEERADNLINSFAVSTPLLLEKGRNSFREKIDSLSKSKNDILLNPDISLQRKEVSIDGINSQLKDLNERQDDIIAKEFSKNAKQKTNVLSKALTEDTIVNSQGWAIGTGIVIANDVDEFKEKLIDVWRHSFSGKNSREDHIREDGQQRGEDGYFYIGGESLREPRDSNGSPKNTYNCKCFLEIDVER